MTIDQKNHLARIKYEFCKDLDVKYELGQKTHGGNLYEKPGMLDNAIEEVLDLAVYLYTLKEQLDKTKLTLKENLKYCQEQNGLPSCKNCGLDQADFKYLDEKEKV